MAFLYITPEWFIPSNKYICRLVLKITELESQIKSLRVKADLHTNIEKDITKRRAMTIKQKMIEISVQTEADEPVENGFKHEEVLGKYQLGSTHSVRTTAYSKHLSLIKPNIQ